MALLNFRTLDLNLLRVFDVVMAERNLTRAGVRLSLTQPAVSNALRRLRLAVGEDLITRTASGVEPTAHAEALWPAVRSALGTLRTALAPEVFDPERDAAVFRLAMADATAAMFMPPLVAQIQQAKAVTDLRVLPLTTRDPARLLERGDADFAIGYFPETVAALTVRGDDAPLRRERLQQSDYVVVMRHGHPLAEAPLTLDAYCAAHHLLVSFSGRAHGLTDQALGRLDRKRRVVLTVNQYFTAGRVVASSDLITVLPAYFIGATGFREHVVTRPLPFALPGLTIDLLWHLRTDGSPTHAWMRRQLLLAVRAGSAEPSTPGSRVRTDDNDRSRPDYRVPSP